MSYLISVDDGHGMETAGKRTPALKSDIKFNGKIRKKGTVIKENEFNNHVMKFFIEGCKRCGIKTLEVAKGDTDVPLATRVRLANNAKSDLHISFHANAVGNTWQEKAYGLVVIKRYVCSSKTDKLATNVYNYLKSDVKWYKDGGTKYGVRKDRDVSGFSLYILKNTKMPSILVEYGFMDNWEDVKIMCTDEFAKNCAEATLKGVCKTLGVPYKALEQVNQPFIVRITCNTLNVRSGASTSYPVVTKVHKGEAYTIIEEKNGWGKLKSGTGWINISDKYVKRV